MRYIHDRQSGMISCALALLCTIISWKTIYQYEGTMNISTSFVPQHLDPDLTELLSCCLVLFVLKVI